MPRKKFVVVGENQKKSIAQVLTHRKNNRLYFWPESNLRLILGFHRSLQEHHELKIMLIRAVLLMPNDVKHPVYVVMIRKVRTKMFFRISENKTRYLRLRLQDWAEREKICLRVKTSSIFTEYCDLIQPFVVCCRILSPALTLPPSKWTRHRPGNQVRYRGWR